ncbi:MAG: hypothetical protein J6A16_00505, partial [Oscillospiraceae bacterium]|nr:hypothetical protein [Oscillospiraceae bacterium]
VKDQYGDPYFQNVSYTGFEKVNVSEENAYIVLRTHGDTKYDTVFEYTLTMNIKAGSDEDNAKFEFEEQAAETEEVAE